MKKIVLLMVTALWLMANADAFDVKLLANNKEAYTRQMSKSEIDSAVAWGNKHSLGQNLKTTAVKALSETFNEMERIDTNCELGLVNRLTSDAKLNQIIKSDSEIVNFVRYLRAYDLIDDILFKMLIDSANVNFAFKEGVSSGRPLNLYTRQNADIDLEKFYQPVKTWPDDIKKCSLDTYFNMTQNLTWKNAKDRDSQMSKLNYMAWSHGVIDEETFARMEVLRKHKVLEWPIYFKRYADVINNAKDRLTKSPEGKTAHNFTVEYVSKRDKLTQRSHLYMNYSSTQVMILAQIIEKTAKRMDARQATLNWQYTDDPNGEVEIYVLSPMEQYRAAIKMLRKDMAEVMRSDGFRGVGFTYDDLIAAAFEAGFVKSSELDQVLKFEDFWNPKTPKWKAWANFAFSLAGTATFYLPPPWNIIGAIGLVLTQTKLVNGDKAPDADENWNVII